jgi:hypothetical protein
MPKTSLRPGSATEWKARKSGPGQNPVANLVYKYKRPMKLLYLARDTVKPELIYNNTKGILNT